MCDLNAYEREERLLSNRQRVTRNVFFALGTSREQANAAVVQGRTNTSELGFVEKAPKYVPRNVFIGRSIGRSSPKVRTMAGAAEDEATVARLHMKIAAENEAMKPLDEKPEEVQKRAHSTLGTPGITISNLPRFGSAGSSSSSAAALTNAATNQRPGSAVTSIFGGGGTTARDTSAPSANTTARTASLTTPRRPALSARQAQIEQDKENEIAAQRAAALHPTKFVEKEIKEYREKVREMCARPTFGPPPPLPGRPGSAALSSSSCARQRSGSEPPPPPPPPQPSSTSGGGVVGPPPLTEGLGLPRAKDFVLPWERAVKQQAREAPVDTAMLDAGGLDSWMAPQPSYVGGDGKMIYDDDEAKRRADQEWNDERMRILDSFGLLQGARSADSAKKRAGMSSGPNTIVNIAKQVPRSASVSYHARTTEHHDLFYDHSDDATSKTRHLPTVSMAKYSKRAPAGGGKTFHYVPDDLLKSDHLLKTHAGMVERERNNFVRLLTDATEHELKTMKQHEKEAERKRRDIEHMKLLMSASAACRGGVMAGGGGGAASAAAVAELRKKEAELVSLEMDPLKVARCDAAKTFLKQFTPPDSVDVPGLPISAADDARFCDAHTTTTRARPKTSGEAVVSRRFKGAPNLGSYSDRKDDSFAHEFGTGYHASRRAAAKEVDAMLEQAHLRKMMK